MNYYNENDPAAAEWLKELIGRNLIPAGEVDTRSIVNVKASEIKHFTQWHFFAGIAGWPLALQLAGWSETRPVTTGSCPCQPFSAAGKQQGKNDERHLLPIWLDLIGELTPATIFGEQVSSAIAHGWLDDVYQGLEAKGYAVGAAVLPACSVGAPHKRDRLFFAADRKGNRWKQGHTHGRGSLEGSSAEQRPGSCGDSRGPLGLAQSQQLDRIGRSEFTNTSSMAHPPIEQTRAAGQSWKRSDVGNPAGEGSLSRTQTGIHNGEESARPRDEQSQRSGNVGHPDNARSQGRNFHAECRDQFAPWSSGVEWIECADGKQRLVKSSLQLLAHGVPRRVDLLKGFGNAIVAPLAAKFIRAYMDISL